MSKALSNRLNGEEIATENISQMDSSNIRLAIAGSGLSKYFDNHHFAAKSRQVNNESKVNTRKNGKCNYENFRSINCDYTSTL